MDHLLTAAVCGLLGAIVFGVLGGLFGGAVRALGMLRDRLPGVASVGQAFRDGVRSGSGFMAVLGGLIGTAIVFVEPSVEEGIESLVAGITATGMLMLIIVLGIAVPTTAVVWLALRHRRGCTPGAECPESRSKEKDGKIG